MQVYLKQMKRGKLLLFSLLKELYYKMVIKMDKKDLINKVIDKKKDREQIKIEPNARILFIGDSITDAGREYGNPDDLGKGYVQLISAYLSNKYPDYDL